MHDVDVGVIRQLQVVDARHDGWQEVVGVLTAFCHLTDDGQRRNEASQTCNQCAGVELNSQLRCFQRSRKLEKYVGPVLTFCVAVLPLTTQLQPNPNHATTLVSSHLSVFESGLGTGQTDG